MEGFPNRRPAPEPEWESEGWTVVVQTNVATAATGWVTMVFQQPFEYDGTNLLMVDFSFHNDGYGESGECRASPAEALVAASLLGAYDELVGGVLAEPPQNVFTPPEGENSRGFLASKRSLCPGNRLRF